jgi:hypothetical protein
MSDGNELDGTIQDLKAFESGVKSATGALGDLTKSAKGVSGGTFSGNSPSGGPIMGNSLAPVRQPNEGETGMGMRGMVKPIMAQLGLGAFSAGISYVQGKYEAMPDVQATVDRATGYYNAGLYGTMGGGAKRMQSATFSALNGAITSAGSDYRTAEYLGSRGMTQNMSNYLGTVGAVANSAKYLNMSNERSAVALEGLTSGKTSSDLLRNLGIYTSDPRTGQAKSQGQLFGEIANRLTAGQSMATSDQVNESFRRGKLGASLSGLGLSEDQQHMMHMFMLARSQGVNLDLENEKSVKAFAEKNGFNPAQMGYQSLSADAGAQNAAQENYIQAIKNTIPEIERLSKEAGDLAAGPVGSFKAMKAALEGSVAGAASVKAAEEMVATALTALAGVIGTVIAAIGGGAIGGGGLRGAAGGVSSMVASKSGGSLLGSVAKSVGKASLITAALSTVASGTVAANDYNGMLISARQNKTEAPNLFDVAFKQNMQDNNKLSSLGFMDQALNFIPTALNNLGRYFGATLSYAGNFLGTGDVNNPGKTLGGGGTNSTINAQGPTGTGQQNTVKFTWPAGNASLVSDGFGPRTPPKPGASSYHEGIDIGVGMGTPIMASADGDVIMAGNNGGLGNCVEIKHANGYVTIYGHQSRIATSVGKKVVQGQVIGYVGSTGTSTGAHLHFGVRDASGKLIDPMKVLYGTSSATYGSQNDSATASGSSAPASDMAGISDSRAKAGIMTVSSYRGAEVGGGGANSGFKAMAMGSNSQTKGNMALGTGASGKNNLTSSSMGIYLPGARRAKTGDPYVANDGPVNVHSGEAILTSEQAEVWRTALKQGGLGKGGGNNVTINLSIAQASETEARRFANIVKDMLEKDTLIKNMGMK